MAARTGEEYLAGLRDNRNVWVNGVAVSDVAQSDLFRGSLAGMAGYFDWQHKFADACVIESEGGACNVSHLISGRPLTKSQNLMGLDPNQANKR